uniref:hypothetical protein n=1 Tax=uncultured Paracoccus sp. TaxID=189685 RepID=UPI00351A974A
MAVLVFAGMAAGKWTFAEISRDPSAQFGTPLYGGFVSTLGFAGWIIAAAATGLAALTQPLLRRLMLPVCLLSALLALDDQFMLHDAVLPRFGIPEKLMLIAEGLLCLRAVWPFLPALLRGKQPLLAVALAGFAASLLIDIIVRFDTGTALMIEDMAKFTGITFWATHWFVYAAAALRVVPASH